MILRTKVEVYVDRLYCEQCGTEMQATGDMLASNPPLFPHVCRWCEHSENIQSEKFPRTIYQEIE